MWDQQRPEGGKWLIGVLVHRIVEEMGVVMNEWKDTNGAGIAGNSEIHILCDLCVSSEAGGE